MTALNTLDVPIIEISQGYDSTKNLMGRKLYVRPILYKWPMTDLRTPFWHTTYVGDSGTPQFVILNDQVYLFAITLTTGTQSGIQVGNYIDYVNEMIQRADDAAGISTGYTVQNSPLPTLDELTTYGGDGFPN